LFIGLTIWVWAFMLWILYWFYKAARGKYERFMVAAFAVGFALSTVEPFVSRRAAANLQFVGTGASLLSLAAALSLLVQFGRNPHDTGTEDHLR